MTRCSAVLQVNYLGRSRSTQRRELVTPDDEMALTEDIVRLAGKYGRYGYRCVTAVLRVEGWQGGALRYLFRQLQQSRHRRRRAEHPGPQRCRD